MIDYNRIAKEYAKHRRIHPSVLAKLIHACGRERDSRVLEVGCGTGNYIIAIAEEAGCMCFGIDPYRNMLSEAEARSQSVKFKLGKAEDIDYPERFFDLVFSVDVLHHVEDKTRYYREVLRVLKPAAAVCTVTESSWIIRNRIPLSRYFPETVRKELDRYPRIEEIKEMHENLGFRSIRTENVELEYLLEEIDMYREKSLSALHLISEESFREGIRRMEEDLQKGPVPCTSRYTMIWAKKKG